MSTLSEALDQVRQRIALYQGKELNEQNTKTALIDPVLRVLGWEVGNLEEVSQEYKRNNHPPCSQRAERYRSSSSARKAGRSFEDRALRTIRRDAIAACCDGGG
jgi:hypothetical protein